jgi:exo-rhamnogalacturonan lyase-like protein
MTRDTTPLPDPIVRLVQPPLGSRMQTAEPVTMGVPFPAGLLRDASRLGLADEDGSAVALQALPTERWPDGSVRWALIDFCSTGAPARERSYRIVLDAPSGAAPRGGIAITSNETTTIVDTGAATFTLARGAAFPFARVAVGGADVLDEAHAPALILTDARGRESSAAIRRVVVEEQGDLRSTIRIEASAGGSGRSPLLELIARVEFFAGSGATRIAITARNPRRARHRGGLWELGDEGAAFLRDLSLRIPLRDPVGGACAAEIDSPFEPVGLRCELYQDSSGGEAWRHENHVNRDDIVPCAFRGYRFGTLSSERTGLRATPAITVTQSRASIALAVAHFWENFPRAIELEPQALTLRLWPHQSAAPHELQGGEQKTHRFALAFGDDPMARDAVSWGRAPATRSMTPEWYSAAGAVPYLTPAADDRDPRYRQLIDAAIDGDESFERKRETIDEYGWRNFGDLYADHENPFSREPAPIVSHYNNQYDAIGGFAVQFMRTGDPRWSRLMTELAAHVEDIDIYHTDRDKAAFNGGLFWHTYHYVAAGRCSHRSYPRKPGVCGGGPGDEHNYAGGLRLHWLLTGDPLSREAAISLANWVVNMDDGRRTVLRWLSSSDTGLASATNSPDYHGPGRGAGNSILALVDGHRLTGERRYLAKAEQLIRRCIHPADDIGARELLDAERRWSYVVFLQVLGKYLDYKVELGENDAMYAYGRDALLHYARWMADHEYPYLDKPEILEFPTETWAAQDMRKGEVFTFAAQFVDTPDRSRFVERAQFFFDASLSALIDAPTRSMARPIVLLLSNGFMRVAGRAPGMRPAPACREIADRSPAAFVPQKALAKKRLQQTAVAATMLVAIVLLGAITSCRFR